ncbi:carboxymuconolactone decarboxylase family protein [Piscinibacter terrae]|uniref:Carboxymuconolactone decarboxylase family protein n=1 Tax=Piscinibacter terrae TaxID=2496871 RepID=A0A3N7HSV8_9BURK|nr:carboxymuconolactone decarboxylase family protein [Albitalea terrae]RQP25380.1 carboxymuconolactone decarboxylase family protein [Albitalea terrae]
MADSVSLPQGYTRGAAERLPMPPAQALDESQRAAAQALLDGPRKGVYGPFVPLMRSPQLLDRVANLGEHLRFHSSLDARVRELAICVAARHVSNQFEWVMHAPLAVKAGVSAQAIEALRQGARPRHLAADEEDALDFAQELLSSHGVSDPTYQSALARWGEKGVVELTTLIGYFAMVSWLMNVARTPSQAGAAGPGIDAFPL